jgi:hypothetical protein
MDENQDKALHVRVLDGMHDGVRDGLLHWCFVVNERAPGVRAGVRGLGAA